jgi:hypothetical protein
VTDATLYSAARQYGGLDPNSTSSTTPTGTNQNGQLNANNQLQISLEYAADGSTYCSSPSGPLPPRTGELPCTLFSLNGSAYPPQPTSNPYKIRITVSSTSGGSNGAFLGAFMKLLGSSAAPSQTTQSDPSKAACLLSGSGVLFTCAQTIATIKGTTVDTVTSPVIPVSTADCNVAPQPGDTLYELWGSSGNTCNNFSYAKWNSVVDFSTEAIWCNNVTPDYKYANDLPAGSYVAGGCPKPSPYTDYWNRNGYALDPSYPGTGVAKSDAVQWISAGFGGTITTTIQLPTYLDAQPDQGGDLGQNIATAFYCSSSSVQASTCTANGSGLYFFGQSQPGMHNVCNDGFSNGGAGCRDATIVTFTNPQVPNGNDTPWSSVNKNPDRITVARLLNFRFYCDHDGNGFCDNPPKSIVGNASNSTVWGRFASPFFPTCPTCTGGPSIYGNTISFGG